MGHHYVPRFYLRGFETNKRIWAYDQKDKIQFCSQVKTVANETKLYSQELESHLANNVEAPAESAFTAIRSKQTLNDVQRVALARYIITLWKRVPAGRHRLLERLPSVADDIHANLNAKIDAAAKSNPDLANQAAAFKNRVAEAVASQKKTPSPDIWHHTIQSETDADPIKALLSMNWVFLFHENLQFLTSDNPVFIFDSIGIGRPSSEMSFPISASIALWATRSQVKDGCFLQASTHAVREINRRTAHNASRYVFAQSDESWILPFVTKDEWQLTRLHVPSGR
jgi:hypothetical protein